MKKNTIPSIVAALREYDGCEFDVRLTRDRTLVIHHNAIYMSHRLLEKDFNELQGVDTFEALVRCPHVVELVNLEKKTLWIEAKEDSGRRFRRDPVYCREIAAILSTHLRSSELDPQNVYIISFYPGILKHVSGFQTLAIVPYVFAGNDAFFPHYNFKTIRDMLIPLRRHIRKAKRDGRGGLLFTKHFLRGFFSLFQPPLKELVSMAGEDFILGTEAQTFEEEKAFRDIVVITDCHGGRGKEREEGAGPLICHRGLGKL